MLFENLRSTPVLIYIVVASNGCLAQIYALLDMEQEHELHLHHAVPPQSPSQHQWSSSPSSSSLVLSASSATTAFCQQPAQASSLDTPFSPFPYGYLETIPNLNREEIMSQARHKDGSGTSAFRQYVRHLHPKKKLKQGACGQRAIKTAMSVLVKMHSARLSQRQRQSSRTEMAAPAVPSSDESNNIQLQHLLSERKRREKINDSFDALRNALPPSSKVYIYSTYPSKLIPFLNWLVVVLSCFNHTYVCLSHGSEIKHPY
jgi:hypothetical protein